MISIASLKHHGIKGQQWGVRHGPPYPLDPNNPGDITIRKGTKFQRLSVHDESAAVGHAYVNFLKSDAQHYKGFFGARLRAINKGADVYSISMTAKNNMRSPSDKNRLKAFLELYESDPLIAKKMGDYYKADYHNFTPLPKSFYEYKFSKLNPKDLRHKGYKTFVYAVGDPDGYIRTKYFDLLAKKGYSFVIDDCDAGRFGKEPAIIFDRKKSVKYEGQTKVSKKEIYDTWRQEGTYIKDAKPKWE